MSQQGERYAENIQYHNGQQDYVVRLRKRSRWWLWLLLLPLLLLLLLIRCEHDITVHATDNATGEVVAGASVQLTYQSHFLYDNGHFLTGDSVTLEQETDADGNTVFQGLRCSVFSYIFYALSQATIAGHGECIGARPIECNFHYTRHVELKMDQRRSDLYVLVLDKETEDPLADATVAYTHTEGGKQVTDSVKTDPNGRATLPDFFACGMVDLLRGSCHGYADTTRAEVPARQMLAVNDSTTLRLRPIKKRITFFVKDVTTRQPIPGAEAEVTLTDSHSKVTRSKSTTNVDGKGQGFFDDAFVLAKVSIKASKSHYNDSTLTGDYTVEQFLTQPEDNRTVWLRPEPFVEEFEDVDSVTGKPLAGVTNRITVTAPDGKVTTTTETSNRNGKFPVKAREGSRIHIESQLRPDYRDKVTDIPSFSKPEKVRMQPDVVTLNFRTIDQETGTLVDHCHLSITTTVSHVTRPASSGSGSFSVPGLRHGERISITASKSGYATNSTKIQNASVDELLTSPQERRDIPMLMQLPPCSNEERGRFEGDPMNSKESYNMGKRSGAFKFQMMAQKVPDRFIVYDGPDSTYPVIFDEELSGDKTVTLEFHNKAVTVEGRTSETGSYWRYKIFCP